MDERKKEHSWFLKSLAGASFTGVVALIASIAVFGLSRWVVPTGLGTFLLMFALLMYFNPRLWYRRMAEACLFAIVTSPFFSGVTINVSSTTFTLPEPHWLTYVALPITTIFFALMHWYTTSQDFEDS